MSKQTLKHPSLLLTTYWRQALKSGLCFNLNFSDSCNWKPQNSLYFHISIFINFSSFGKIWPVRKRLELFRILIFLQIFNYFRIEELQFWLFDKNLNQRTIISPSHFRNLIEPVIPCKNRQRTDSYGRLFDLKKI